MYCSAVVNNLIPERRGYVKIVTKLVSDEVCVFKAVFGLVTVWVSGRPRNWVQNRAARED